jgi:DedD protein
VTAKKSNGDMVLGGRHLVGIFLLLVVVFAVVFTLGYLLGRSQYDSSIRAASKAPSKAPSTQPAAVSSTPAADAARSSDGPQAQTQSQPTEWDFYRAAQPAKSPARLTPQPRKEASARKSSAARRTSRAPVQLPRADRSLTAPLIPHGAAVLQVAALTHQSDALALAEALQKRKFRAFVLTPAADHFYRVQVGPYATAESANVARRRLERQGFKSIVKR